MTAYLGPFSLVLKTGDWQKIASFRCWADEPEGPAALSAGKEFKAARTSSLQISKLSGNDSSEGW